MSVRIPRRDTEIRFVTKFGENRPLQSCRKVTWFTKQKKLAPRDTSQPHFAKNGPIAPKIPERCHPWHVHIHQIWSRSAAFCRTYSWKIDFLAQKVNTIYPFSLQ